MATAELSILIKARNEAAGVLADLDRQLGKAKGSTGGLSGAFGALKNNALPVVGVLAGATAGVVALGINFANAASNLGEAKNKALVTFGDFVDGIEEFAETSAGAFGISERAAFEYTATLGTILRATGLNKAESANMSTEMTKLAADLASFNNIGIDEALEKLRSGLVGEAEPLRTVGVLISAAAVDAKAAQMGLGGLNRELTEGEKVQARYALIMEQTVSAQGDFERTSDGLANQQRIFGAVMEDVKASLGQAFLPMLTRVMGALNGFLIENKEEIAEFGEKASLWMQDKLPKALKLLRETWEDLQPSIKEFVAVLREDVMPIVQQVIAFVQDHWPEIRAVIEFELREIQNKIKLALDVIEGAFHIFHGILTGDFGEAWDGLKQIATGAMDFMKEAIKNRLDLIAALFGGVFEGIKGIVTGAVNFIIDRINDVLEAAREVDRALPEAISPWDVPDNIAHVGVGSTGNGSAVPPNLLGMGGMGGGIVLGATASGGGAGGSVVVNVHVNADMTDATIQKVARHVEEAANAGLRRTGLQGVIVGAGMGP